MFFSPAMQMMVTRRVHRVWVTDDSGRLERVVSMSDLLSFVGLFETPDQPRRGVPAGIDSSPPDLSLTRHIGFSLGVSDRLAFRW